MNRNLLCITPLLAILVAVTSLSGCRTDKPLEGKLEANNGYPNATISDTDLQKLLRFQPYTSQRVENGNLQISQPVRSLADYSMNLQYRVIWFDAQGVPLAPQGSWIPKTLEPNQPDYIVSNSTSDRAVDFNVQFRRSRRGGGR